MLGICRGMQLMAVHAGGTLDQHTPDLVGHDDALPRRRRLRRRRGRDRGRAPGWRRSSGRGSRSAATTTSPWPPIPASRPSPAPTDGTVEAMEAAGDRFRLAVQWHPETRVEIGLMAGLVAAAREHGRAGRHTDREALVPRLTRGHRAARLRRSVAGRVSTIARKIPRNIPMRVRGDVTRVRHPAGDLVLDGLDHRREHDPAGQRHPPEPRADEQQHEHPERHEEADVGEELDPLHAEQAVVSGSSSG